VTISKDGSQTAQGGSDSNACNRGGAGRSQACLSFKVLKEQNGDEVHVTVEEFDEDTQAFVVKKHGKRERKARGMSRGC
jgi:hypothetical protein